MVLNVEDLEVHLENFQRVYYRPNAPINAEARVTKLMKFFELCQNDDFASTLRYIEVPQYYTWNRGPDKGWHRRKNGTQVEGYPGIRKTETLGRIHTVSPSQEEAFCLRLLLNMVQGPTSFQDIKTVDGIQHDTFRSAARARGLLDNDDHLNGALQEAALTDSPAKMRNLFVIILAFGQPSDPLQLWLNHRDELSSDLSYQAGIATDEATHHIFNQALIKIEDRLLMICGKILKDFSLPETNRQRGATSFDMLRETSYAINELERTLEDIVRLTDEQKLIFEDFKENIENGLGGFWFIDAPGGTGKTFLANIMLAWVRIRGLIALAVASSGIASQLMKGGRTAHAAFKIPLNLKDEKPTCNINLGTNAAEVIAECQIIIWDECTMSHRKAFEAVDRLLRDITKCDEIMGGKLVSLKIYFIMPTGIHHLKLLGDYDWRFSPNYACYSKRNKSG